MNAANTANTYKTQQIMTASPEELTLMLYNGALKFVAESMLALEQQDYEKSHNANLRAQAIVREFAATLDMKFELASNWLDLYEYIEYCLIQGNLKKDPSKLAEAKEMLQEFRDTWYQVIKQTRQQKAAAR